MPIALLDGIIWGMTFAGTMHNNKKYFVGGACGLVVGLVAFAAYSYFISPNGSVSTNACAGQYILTSHVLPCSKFDTRANRLQVIDTQLDNASALYVSEGKATSVSIFVRDLIGSQYASSNETQTYAPASLLKLPLMIAYYKVAQIEPNLLKTPLVYKVTSSILNDSSQNFKPAEMFTLGSTHTVEELIEDMIINSDNNSTAILLQHLDPQVFANTLVDLGIEIPTNGAEVDFVTAKSYSGIFRMLYNASYLNRDYSEKALELLSQEAFKGIATPLPATLTVAHKFGEREVDNPDGSSTLRELHDCGIVYNDTRPYSICIMTQGKNFEDLQSIITDLSQLTYQYLK